MTVTDERVELTIDITKDVPCAASATHQPAVWACTTRCCRTTFPLCQQCRDDTEEYLRVRAKQNRPNGPCRQCQRRPGLAPEWRPL